MSEDRDRAGTVGAHRCSNRRTKGRRVGSVKNDPTMDRDMPGTATLGQHVEPENDRQTAGSVIEIVKPGTLNQ